MKPTQEQFAAYQNLFEYFNNFLFQGSLPNVVLNFSRKAKTHGFFAPERWSSKGGDSEDKIHEISLNPQTLARDPKDVLSTLVHEMAHLWQQVFGKPSRSGYHNKEWAAKMKEIGLIPSSTGAPGGKETGQNMTHYIEDKGPYEVAYKELPEEYLMPFIAHEGLGATKKSTNSKVKYSCLGCGSNVWGKPNLNIMCGDCQEHMIGL
jgi:predicted SprT family Zn-dependent metalloprotease